VKRRWLLWLRDWYARRAEGHARQAARYHYRRAVVLEELAKYDEENKS
jgi:hypothetical protein